MPHPSEREIEVFNTALDLPAAERAPYLDQTCAGDPAGRRRVEELLRAGDEAGAFLEGAAPPPPLALAAQTGDRIGRYQLLEQIGEGGCGVVYLAEQAEPVRRQVALKVIKLGMDTKSVIARFEAERQALALMEHPNIAKVFDAGATETGRPYFVMELVRGVKITDYCQEHGLATRARLGLFTQVCRAVQHAHQKGIIHRDLKPSNILVTLSDGAPMPKVIDFGIAKATQGKLTDATLFTACAQFVGTPAYMSPEQAELSAQDIDTRSDIYSLGVLLYELLTGHTPFDATSLGQAGLDELRRIIREKEPPPPSTRLSQKLVAADAAKRERHKSSPSSAPEAEEEIRASPALRDRLLRIKEAIALVRGDLDWIVMKCLEKDRRRRYETANGLAADIQRHLNNEPVLASPPGNLYRFQKWARRHRIACAAGTLVLLALFIGLGTALTSLALVKRAKDDAIEKLRLSYLAEARATRMSGEAGQRYASLESAGAAAAIRPDLTARNEFIACLAVSDLRVAKQKVITGHQHNEHANFDLGLERYAFGDASNNIVIRAAANDQVVAVLPAQGVTLQGVSDFSPNGRFLSARYWRDGEGESAWVWDVDNRQVVLRVLQQPDGTNQVRYPLADDFSPDSRFFCNCQADGTVSVFDLPGGREKTRFAGGHPFNRLIADPGGRRLACCTWDDPRVEIRDLAAGRMLLTLNCAPGVSAIAWSADGARAAAAGMDHNIYIWNAVTGRQLGVLPGHGVFIMSLAFSHAGTFLASAGFDDVIRLWNPESGRQVASHRGSSWRLQFSADDGSLLGWQEGAEFGSLAVDGNRECPLLPVPRDTAYLSPPAFSADGRILAAAADHQVCFWDTGSGREIGSLPLPACDALVFTPDGRSLIIVDRIRGIRQWSLDRADGPSAGTWRLGRPRRLFDASLLQSASLSQDGRYLAVTQQTNGQSFIFDLQNPPAKVVLAGHPMVNRIALSPDGRWAATASWMNSLVKIWDGRSGEVVRTIPSPARAYVAFCPDGRWLATSSSEFQLWAVGSWQPKGAARPGLAGPQENFTAFSPDGRIMARTELNKIHLMETATEKPLATLEAPGGSQVLEFQFSPDGTRLAAVQVDKQVQLWNLRLIREELAPVHLDWDFPPYPRPSGLAAGPVTLEIESESTADAR